MGLYCAIPVEWIYEGTSMLSSVQIETAAYTTAFSVEPYAPKGDEDDDEDAEEFYDAVWDFEVPDAPEVDISSAINSFKSAFDSTIQTLCPVRTGFLRNSCHCEISNDMIECFADAEYAQYVEFGTYKMAAQPYFEPAIQAGLDAFLGDIHPIMQDVKKATDDIAYDVIEEIVYTAADFNVLLVLLIAIIISFILALLAELFAPMWDEWIEDITSSMLEYSLQTQII